MSLFVAVRPDERAVDELQHALEPVRRSPTASVLRWQPVTQWHITLAFLGDPDEWVEDEVAERLRSLGAQSAVPGLQLSGAGCFGRQVLWVGLADGPSTDALRAVQEAILPLMRGSGAVADRRPWRPHLTIARARGGDARGAVPLLAGYLGPDSTADEVLLVRSSGGPHPDHRVVERVGLRGPLGSIP